MVRRLPTWIWVFVVGALLLGALPARADDWPQWLGPQRDGIWRETGLVDKFPSGGPTMRWRTPIGEGYSGPVVAQGRVIITDRVLAKGASNPDNPFGKSRVDGTERVLCLDETNGKILWKHEYDCHYEISYPAGPRAVPVIAGDKVYTLGAMGDLYCFNFKTADVIWSKNLPEDYKYAMPMWGCASSPLVDGNRLICLAGGNGSVVVALDKDTGKEIWKALSAKEPGYAPPMIYDIGGMRQLILWHPQSVNSLNPETGESYWSQPYGDKKSIRAGLAIPTPRVAGDQLFLTAFYDGPLMLKLRGRLTPTVEWQGHGRGEQPEDTDGLHSIMSTPFLKDSHIYGVCSYGELRCLDAATGKRIWSTHEATTKKSTRWGNAFLARIDNTDRYVLFNELGDLILAELTPKGYKEISRANILAPTNAMAGGPKSYPGRKVIWSYPAFANRSVYARNDREIVCVSLAQ
jgi:outer membrane protein assembly factor BamB